MELEKIQLEKLYIKFEWFIISNRKRIFQSIRWNLKIYKENNRNKKSIFLNDIGHIKILYEKRNSKQIQRIKHHKWAHENLPPLATKHGYFSTNWSIQIQIIFER